MPEISASLRAEVRNRAHDRCEYCLIPESVAAVAHQVDHILAVKHQGVGESENLALCCARCNKYKGTDMASLDPATKTMVRLFDPRHDRSGRVTATLLQFNRPERVQERQVLIDAGLLQH